MTSSSGARARYSMFAAGAAPADTRNATPTHRATNSSRAAGAAQTEHTIAPALVVQSLDDGNQSSLHGSQGNHSRVAAFPSEAQVLEILSSSTSNICRSYVRFDGRLTQHTEVDQQGSHACVHQSCLHEGIFPAFRVQRSYQRYFGHHGFLCTW